MAAVANNDRACCRSVHSSLAQSRHVITLSQAFALPPPPLSDSVGLRTPGPRVQAVYQFSPTDAGLMLLDRSTQRAVCVQQT